MVRVNTATNWGDWKITDEQATAIYNGDKIARDKFYFDNLDKIRAMAYNHCLKRPYCCGWREDMINGVYVDLSIFESAVNQPVNCLWRLKKFIYASFNACPHGGLAYLYEYNRKLLSGKKEYYAPADILPLDTPVDFPSSLHTHDGGQVPTVADSIPAPNGSSEKAFDIVKRIACRYLSPRSAEYIGYFIEGYGNEQIKALTGKKNASLTPVRKELITHCKTILDDLTAIGFNVEYFYDIDLTAKSEKRYKTTPAEREKRRLQMQRWREKQKSKSNA